MCDNIFKAITVKSSSYRMIKKDSDFFIRYSLINPYFYDVWVCNSCGYVAMKADFNLLRSIEIELVTKIYYRLSGTGECIQKFMMLHIAIERYKLSLLNYVITNAKSSKKAINCMKIAWMYRLIDTDSC